MSVHVLSWVFRHSTAQLADRLVLLVLADHAGHDGRNAYPSVQTIADEALITRRQVQRSLRNLQNSGAIVNHGRSPFQTTNYEVVMTGGRQIVARDRKSPKPSIEEVVDTKALRRVK